MRARIICFTAVFLCLGMMRAEAGWKRLPMDKKQAQKQVQPRKFALVIGINQLQTPYWSPLLYAHKDAIKMTKALISLAHFDHVRLHTRREDTTKAALLRSLRTLKQKVKSPLDTVLVYVSAHGTVAYHPTHKADERFIVTSDTSNKVAQTALSVRAMLSHLTKLPSKHIVLMLATCYTGTPKSKSRRLPGHKGGQLPKGVKPLHSRALQVLSASGFAQAAYESTKLKSDVYTHFFLDCLRKLKRTKASVSAIDAHICASQPTTAFVKVHQREIQVPRVDSQPGANRDVFLYQKQNDNDKVAKGYFWASRKQQKVKYILRAKGEQRQRKQPALWASPGEWIGVRTGRYTVTIRDDRGRVRKRYTITIRRQKWHMPQGDAYDDPFHHRDPPQQAEGPPLHPLVGVGYVLSSAILVGSGSLIVYGAVKQEMIALWPGVIFGSAGGLILFISIIADQSMRRDHRQMQRLQHRLFSGEAQQRIQPFKGAHHWGTFD